jgi:YVTN family beta-propeller protein
VIAKPREDHRLIVVGYRWGLSMRMNVAEHRCERSIAPRIRCSDVDTMHTCTGSYPALHSKHSWGHFFRGAVVTLAHLFGACAGNGSVPSDDETGVTDLTDAEETSGASSETGGDEDQEIDLLQRAYIVSRDSDELTVIDLRTLEIIGQVRTNGRMNHMADLAQDFTKIYVDSSDSDEAVVVDARSLIVTNRILVGKHPTHLTTLPDDRRLAIMLEADDSIAVVDSMTDMVAKTITGFKGPHFLRTSADGTTAYVANIRGNDLTTVDLATLEISSSLALDGLDASQALADESGFADAQIAADGILYAAHAASGRVLVYDTVAKQKLPELGVGAKPWIVFAQHPYAGLPNRQLVPNFSDRTVSLIASGVGGANVIQALEGDDEAYGVNFSPLAANFAFVMNRSRHDIAVVDVMNPRIVSRIAVGGTTETASTSADGRYIVATVSSANRVVIIDAATQKIVKWFDHVGSYPWSVTIPLGQNYCH